MREVLELCPEGYHASSVFRYIEGISSEEAQDIIKYIDRKLGYHPKFMYYTVRAICDNGSVTYTTVDYARNMVYTGHALSTIPYVSPTSIYATPELKACQPGDSEYPRILQDAAMKMFRHLFPRA